MNIKDSNKLRAQEEIKARRKADIEGLELAKKQEELKEYTMDKIYEKIPGGYKIKYIKKS